MDSLSLLFIVEQLLMEGKKEQSYKLITNTNTHAHTLTDLVYVSNFSLTWQITALAFFTLTTQSSLLFLCT